MICRNPALDPLVGVCLICLRRFRDCRRFCESHWVAKERFRDALDSFTFLRHVMRAILSVRPKCSHRCTSLKETPERNGLKISRLKLFRRCSGWQTIGSEIPELFVLGNREVGVHRARSSLGQLSPYLVAHGTGIGDTIPAIPAYIAITNRRQLEMRCPLPLSCSSVLMLLGS